MLGLASASEKTPFCDERLLEPRADTCAAAEAVGPLLPSVCDSTGAYMLSGCHFQPGCISTLPKSYNIHLERRSQGSLFFCPAAPAPPGSQNCRLNTGPSKDSARQQKPGHSAWMWPRLGPCAAPCQLLDPTPPLGEAMLHWFPHSEEQPDAESKLCAGEDLQPAFAYFNGVHFSTPADFKLPT